MRTRSLGAGPFAAKHRFIAKLPFIAKPRFIAKLWPQDTLARRFAVTTVLAILVTLGLSGLFVQFAGVWARPPLRELDLLERADDIVRVLDVVPASQRMAVAAAAASGPRGAAWFPADSPAGAWLDAAVRRPAAHRPDSHQFLLRGQERRVMSFGVEGVIPDLANLVPDPAAHPDAQFLAVGLEDGSWAVMTVLDRFWGLARPARIAIGLTFLVLSIALVSTIATRRMSRPIRDFTEALHRFGANPRAAPMAVTGPRELRRAMGAFNGMQARIQRFVDERTTMLAAISHDLRTPLTRIRLRSELVEDTAQRARLFRDVDEMQAMVGAALAFFSDDGAAEAGTAFDFPGLLHTVVDEQNDRGGDQIGEQGRQAAYAGPDRAAFFGRPLALKRAFTNLVDNAVKYGRCCDVELQCGPEGAVVLVRDQGPGIPERAAEQVFTPFFRLEGSRNRATGGIGLGLTSARAVILDHGGQITLHNRATGGLEVRVLLPRA